MELKLSHIGFFLGGLPIGALIYSNLLYLSNNFANIYGAVFLLIGAMLVLYEHYEDKNAQPKEVKTNGQN